MEPCNLNAFKTMEINESTRTYILRHQDEDVNALALRGSKDTSVNMPFALQQIAGRQKAKHKLPEFYANPDVLYPQQVSMEQCSSSATAQYKSGLFGGALMADLSGGFGVDTFAFARTFGQCHYVEPSPKLCDLVRHNAAVMGLQNIDIHKGSMEEVLPTLPAADLLYVDPSRRDRLGRRVVTIADCTPDLTQWKDRMLALSPLVLAKLSPMLDIQDTLRQLPETSAVHVVAVRGECKELLFLLSRGWCAEPAIHAVNITDGHVDDFTFNNTEEREAAPAMASSLERYLLEPDAAILKAGAFKTVAVRHHLRKLHQHTHLYTCDQPPTNFPGRVFEVTEVVDFHKRSLGQQLKNIRQANVAVRNFPIGADNLRRKLNMADGGEVFLFGATTTDGLKLIVARKPSEVCR